MSEVKDPGTYAKLPAGTRVYFGDIGAVMPDGFKLLQSADQIGSTGEKAPLEKVTRLIDTEEKFMAALKEGPDKEFLFLDDPSDTDQEVFLLAAENNEVKVVRVEFPNGRWAEMTIALAGWELKDLDKNKPMMVSVSGKQNAINRGVTAPAP
ncbi:hypothetical protein K6Y31_20720 [Motilimonas cestriensis]|uniref:Phage tail protein n=1 Tax=Motilimonas cestriensis TaxID=2742685 RepID=A0ABS8WHG3_9GAMM|nr:hypothetical protein [Motilimonas cestriensis]MCE2597201.1 hypothetical protein [Motilimonas cestriensis]